MFDLWSSVAELVREGKRDPTDVSSVLQVVKDRKDFSSILFSSLFSSKNSGVKLAQKSSAVFEYQLRLWLRFYKEVYGVTADLNSLRILEPSQDLNWIIVMLQGMTSNRIFSKMVELGIPCRRYIGDLDVGFQHDRNPDHDYIIRVHPRVEADEELKNLSANQLKQMNIPGITLSERLQLGLFYYWNTQKHLDINNRSYCTGSRRSDGNVPDVNWNGDKVNVNWWNPDEANGNLRSRQVVSKK